MRFAQLCAVTATTSLLLGGCSGGPAALPLKGTVQAAASANPDLQGRPSPVSLRVFQLKSSGSFQGSDFFALTSNASVALGSDLISVQDLSVQPDSTSTFSVELDPQTRAIGVIAGFRSIENAAWKSTVPVPEEDVDDHQLEIQLGELQVQSSFIESDSFWFLP